MKKELRSKILAQALTEIAFARRYKQGRISTWQLNEDLYYGNKKKSDEARANVDLGQMQEHVHTLLSKIDNPLTFKFTDETFQNFIDNLFFHGRDTLALYSKIQTLEYPQLPYSGDWR